MPYPSVEEFSNAVMSRTLEDVVREYLFTGIPYVFRGRPSSNDRLNQHLSRSLTVAPENIVVVGSAKIGFSLSPDTFPRAFSRRSDIDVIIVDEVLFDDIWAGLLKWHYPRRVSGLTREEAQWISLRRKELYWGWFVPSAIPPIQGVSLPATLKVLRDASTKWFGAFHTLGRYQDFASRDISGRLYRTWNHALMYHVDGLRRVQEIVQELRSGS